MKVNPIPPPLPLRPYSARPTGPERPALGLHTLRCPRCSHPGQRLMRANQWWQDQSDTYCARIQVTLDFLCMACDQGWQIDLFNEDEGDGEIILDVSLVETVNDNDAKQQAEFEARQKGDA